MRITESSIKHPITTFMVFIALFILGLISLSRLGLELFPDITFPTAAVITIYPGVGPYEIETDISKPIEEVVSTISGVEKVSSNSGEGISFVTLNFTWGTEMDTIVADIREKISTIEDKLPDESERPIIVKYNPEVFPALVFNVSTSSEGIDIRRLSEKDITPEIEKLEGVATVQIFGGKKTAVTCRLDLDSLSKLEIPITRILQAFKGENINLPGGSIDLQEKYMVIRTIGEFKNLEDIGCILVGYRENVPIYLKDIALISMDGLVQEEYVRAEGGYGVQLGVRKQPGHNTVDVIQRVKKKLKELEAELPPTVKLTIKSDQSKSIIQSIGGVARAAWQGGLLAVLVLLLFLRNIGSTLIISVAIPVSVITTFSFMDFGNIAMNIMSLAGITLGVGMLVDNSIVVLESNYRKQLSGLAPDQASIQGTAEVAKPIIASTLTTIAVFFPLVFVEGIAGLIFRDLAYTISFALFISLAMALTMMPVMCSKFLKINSAVKVNGKNLDTPEDLSLADVEIHTGKNYIDKPSRVIRKGLKNLDSFYARAVSWALDHSLAVVLTAVILLILSIGSIALLGMEFIAETDEAMFNVGIETKVGSPFSRTEAKVMEAEKTIIDLLRKDIVSISSNIGRSGGVGGLDESGSHLAVISVTLVRKDKRTRSIWEIINQISRALEENLVDVRFSVAVEGMGSLVNTAMGEIVPLVIEIEGDNLESSHSYAKKIENIMQETQGTRDIEISHKTGKPELQFKLKRKEAASLGLSALEIAGTIRTAVKGSEVSTYREKDNQYDVVLGLNDEDKKDLISLTKLFFISPAGAKIPLENVVDIEESTGPISIKRQNRVRVIKVTGSLTGERALNKVMADIKKRIEALGPPPPGISLYYSGSVKGMGESFSSLLMALGLAVLLVYMVMASQFESLLHPFIVMFSIPFALVGLVAALLITNTTFSIVAFIGGILLVGIVVNNAIVLIDYINLLRKRGVPLREAIIAGGKTRLKPILMTTLTTVLGLLPMALGLGTGAELRAPMARSVVGGLSTSTLITLILIPAIYWIIESKIRKSA